MRAPLLAAIAIVLVMAGCDDDGTTTPTPVHVPSVAGRYEAWNMWHLQFYRMNDGLTGSFYCPGSLTLAQSGSRLTGFAVVSDPCPPSSFELSGSVTVDRGVSFTSSGPRPPEGQCPAPSAAAYSGVATETQISLRATVNLECPGPGEGPHRFDYIIVAYKQS
jgi:hypothetical protein